MRNQRPVSGSSVAGGGGGGDRSCPLVSARRGDGVPTLGGEKSGTRGGGTTQKHAAVAVRDHRGQ